MVAVHGASHDVEEPRVARRRLVRVLVLRFRLGSRAALERCQVQGWTALAHVIHDVGVDRARLLSDLVQRVERRGRLAVEAALLALVAAAPRDLIDCALDQLVRNFLYLDAGDLKLLQVLEQDVLRVAPALVARLDVRVDFGPGHGFRAFRTGRGGTECLLGLGVKQHAEVVFAFDSGEWGTFCRHASAHFICYQAAAAPGADQQRRLGPLAP